MLARAPQQSLAAFRAAVHRAVLSLDPRGAEIKHEQAVIDRRVCGRQVGDGMGELWALLPLDGLATVMTSLDAAATARIPGDERSVDQRRADALVDLATAALGGTPTTGSTTGSTVGTWQGRRPCVQVTVAATTLAHLDDQPGELEGYGPIPASMARAIAFDATGTWRRLLTDPAGQLIDYGRTTYEPPQPLADHLIARDRTCRFPGCHRPGRRCDIDHLHAWSLGGHTNTDNCECLCSRHHHLKHEAGWTLTGNPNGELIWTTPTGHQYRSPPSTYP